MTKKNGLLLTALAIALGASLLLGGFIPALAQDGEDDGTPETWFENCPMWGNIDNLPENWAETMPQGRHMMWYYVNGEELPDNWAEQWGQVWQDGEFACPLWGDVENLPEDWPQGMPFGGGMMWAYANGEDLPEGWADTWAEHWQSMHGDAAADGTFSPCPMWNAVNGDSDVTWGPGMMGGRGRRGGMWNR